MTDFSEEMPCLVKTGQGFSLSYKNRFLYSKYSPDRAISGAIDSLTILPGTLILALSPALWLGLEKLLQKLPQDSFVLGIETDEKLHNIASEKLEQLKKNCDKSQKSNFSSSNSTFGRVFLLPFKENDYIVNILSGEKLLDEISLPHISTFRRAIPLEMSAGTQFDKENYASLSRLAQNTIASYWKNRITLTKLGRLYSRNIFKNLANLPSAIDFNNLLRQIKRPIFVFGAGESLEATIKNISSEEIEKCFVIGVDAACPALKASKIRIDAVIALEGQVAIEKAYIGASAEDSIIFADITSRKQVTGHTKKSFTYFATKYTDSTFFKELGQKDFFPRQIPALGSVGLTAVYIALLLRENINIPVFVSGLDFSFSLGRTHTKNAPAHIARLCSTNRFRPVENYDAAFRAGAKQFTGKNGISLYTDTALEGYAKSFDDVFSGTPNLYDAGIQGLPLGIERISQEKLKTFLESLEVTNSEKLGSKEEKDTVQEKKLKKAEEIRRFLEKEEKALNRIKELLMFGKDVENCSRSVEDELEALISCREYLFLHFPDGYKCDTKSISFLKRVRSQIDFFLKDIKSGLKAES